MMRQQRSQTITNDREPTPPRRESVAVCLASGSTVEEASRKLKVGSATVRRWLKEEAFRDRVKELRREITDQQLGRLVGAMATATDTLVRLCNYAKGEGVRLMAARAIHELRLRVSESQELETRITALEKGNR